MEEKGVGRPSTYAAIIATIQDREYVSKTDKRLAPTPLGEVVNGLMVERFSDIVNVEFTADMEKQLDRVEEGQVYWKEVLRKFYGGFHQEMLDAEQALDGVRLKVPDEVTDEKCELCGRNLVVKTSRFGKFLACPGYPECKFTKPITEKMPGRCPKCGSAILKRKSKRGYAYYACERGAEVRLYDVGRADRSGLPGLWTDDVQALRARRDEAVLHQPGVRELPAGGQARLSPEGILDRRGDRREQCGGGSRGRAGDFDREKGKIRCEEGRKGRKDRGKEARREEVHSVESGRQKTGGEETCRKEHGGEEARCEEDDNHQDDRREKDGEEGYGMKLECTVVGAGLAGCEAAWQLAERGVHVTLHEMKPQKMTPAHHCNDFAELVCSNSLRGDRLENAVGLLKEELRRLGSLILQCAEANRVEAGGALAVDRYGFSGMVTEKIRSHPNITVVEGEVTEVPQGPVIIATGPLTSDALGAAIQTYFGGADYMSFFDAAAPLVSFESIDMERAWFASRYDRGEADYVNCSMERDEYAAFVEALTTAEEAEVHGFEDCEGLRGLYARGGHGAARL